ncbi:MAG: nucleotidyl transferase AbiEii/AbiGii toxin family protein [Desulfobacteraceae bacterium]|nr:MAG: nucleotidyl transferase AbiEii/AbiGii toxin family protein [Desulfobacteraceae bacterium]
MIPKADIVAWRRFAPWVADAQVEQDLVLSRAMIAVFHNSFLSERLAMRGGTALHKLYFNNPRRYSEDIDLVQISPAPIGQIMDTLQKVLNPFLGVPRRKQALESAVLVYKMESEGLPIVPMRLKVEINTREHFSIEGYKKRPLQVSSRWFEGFAEITTFSLEELLATKVRALYQRRKGRDLFDLWLGLQEESADSIKIIEIFKQYMARSGLIIERTFYEKNLTEKLDHIGFKNDIRSLVPADLNYNIQEAYALILNLIINRI